MNAINAMLEKILKGIFMPVWGNKDIQKFGSTSESLSLTSSYLICFCTHFGPRFMLKIPSHTDTLCRTVAGSTF